MNMTKLDLSVGEQATSTFTKPRRDLHHISSGNVRRILFRLNYGIDKCFNGTNCLHYLTMTGLVSENEVHEAYFFALLFFISRVFCSDLRWFCFHSAFDDKSGQKPLHCNLGLSPANTPEEFQGPGL